ncbi:MAG: DUF4276 family protein [Pseudonocardiaceae bacterium]
MRIHVLVEGQTEKIVFDELIAAELQAAGHYPSSSIVATKKPAAGGKFRGGVTSWHQLRSEILKLAPAFDLVSTMIDYYGFPADAPGMSDRPSGPASLRASHVEQRIAESVDCTHFRPFLVMHEIEAWVLAAAAHLGRCAGGWHHVRPRRMPSAGRVAAVPARRVGRLTPSGFMVSE